MNFRKNKTWLGWLLFGAIGAGLAVVQPELAIPVAESLSNAISDAVSWDD